MITLFAIAVLAVEIAVTNAESAGIPRAVCASRMTVICSAISFVSAEDEPDSVSEFEVLTKLAVAVRTAAVSSVVSSVSRVASDVSIVALFLRIVLFWAINSAFDSIEVVALPTLEAVAELLALEVIAPKRLVLLTDAPLAREFVIAVVAAADFVDILVLLVTVDLLLSQKAIYS